MIVWPSHGKEIIMEAFRRFMRNRYGIDPLGKAMLLCAVLVSALAVVTKLPLTVISYLLIAFELYRFFSADIYRRTNENLKYDALKKRVIDWFRLEKNKIRDRGTHRYLKCPTCRANLRVPRGRGKISVTCPVCKTVTITKT